MVEAGVEGGWQRLAASDESSPASAAIPIVLLVASVGLDDALDDLLDIANLDEDVFGLKVGVDDAAFAMEIVEAKENLLCDLLDQRHGDSAVVPALDKAKQVLAENLKHHAYMGAMWPLVLKRIKQTHDVFATGMVRLGLYNLIEELDLVDGGLGVVGGGTDNLEGDMLAARVVAGQPDG